MAELASPVEGKERIVSLDIIRGIALLGILLVNMWDFSGPDYRTSGFTLADNWWDQAAQWFVLIVAQGKFYPMFSFLFGVGAIFFLERAEQKGAEAKRLFVRRLLVLLGFGLIHGIFIWSGDILLTYALLGFALLYFYRQPVEKVLKWAWGLLLVPFGLVLSLSLVGLMAMGEVDEYGQRIYEREDGSHGVVVQWEITPDKQVKLDAYGEGTFADQTAQRLEELGETFAFGLFYFPTVLAMFLFGVYAAKQRMFHNVEAWVPFIRKVWKGSLFVGIVTSILHIIGEAMRNPALLSIYDVLELFVMISGPALCFFYITSIVLLLRDERWQMRLKSFAPVGRMGISNYLLQSLIATTIFYSYGLGLYGEVGPAVGLALSLAIYGAQFALSHLLMKRYRFGPVEWLWRTLTYGRRL